ncbi:MAG: GH92 family glycosyl hydrolase [Candidatus Cyclobacteriaceae bacterium M3_2C_046]
MKKICYLAIMAFLLSFHSCQLRTESKTPDNVTEDLVTYVNPLMGTDSEFKLSNGNIYPAIALPWGMNFWSPQTGKMGDGWGYTYDAYQIRGIKQTHQPSPWINDYGAFSLMPVTGQLVVHEDERGSWFSHKAETAAPHYYKVYLADYDVLAEVTPTDRAAQFRFTFPQTDSAYVLLDAFNQGSYVKIIPSENKIVGYSRNNHGGVPENFHNYFVAVFDKPFTSTATWNEWQVNDQENEAKGDHVGAVLRFKTRKGEKVQVKIASSFISPEQAEINLNREIGKDYFENTLAKAKQQWNQELNRIKVEGGTEDQKKTFYSCLYRSLLFPRKFYEFDQDDQMIHYSPYNGEVLPGYMFTDNGFWDTFRAIFPFFTLMYPEFNAQVMQGLANTYKESGWLPEWASPGHRNAMIGSNSAAIIADAYLKGIRDYDIETLYQAILKNTRSVGPVHSVGRYGAEYYNQLGYVPYDVGIKENAARTLEYAYADYTISRLAEAMGKPQSEIDTFRQKAMNYKHLFDPSTKLMRGKNEDGSFQSPFNPFKWGDAFTEGNSWHYTWSVFQDVQGLIDLMGGEREFVAMLDSVFTMPPVYDESYYGIVIHEIREMQIMNMGQYAHGNQPIQHMIYLYNYAGQPWKAQYWNREVMDKLYHSGPDGYCGDEDNGQTSAWYVFSAMGFYPVCPGSNQYVIGSPVFNKMTLQLENGNVLEINAPENAPQRRYVDQIIWNGSAYDLNYLEHADLMKGGKLEFQMSERPNKKRGTSPESFPFSLSREYKEGL